jgi:GTP-binding protein EngB required for normal cell division
MRKSDCVPTSKEESRFYFKKTPAFAVPSCLFQLRSNFGKSSFLRHLIKDLLDEESENYKISTQAR